MVSLLIVVVWLGIEVVLDAVDDDCVPVVCGVLVTRDNIVGTNVVEVSEVDAIVDVVSEDVFLVNVVGASLVVVSTVVVAGSEEIVSCV